MYRTEDMYANRNGDEYYFKPMGDNKYLFVMQEGTSMTYCRMGGKDGQTEVDWNDLGYFDPSGGPFIALGETVDGKEIVKISNMKEGFLLEVANNDC